MKRMTDRIFGLLVDRLVEECRGRSINGIFAVADLEGFLAAPPTIRWSLILRDNLVRVGVPDKPDVNNLAIVLAKIAMVTAHKVNTGGETKLIGEVPYQGGRLSSNREFAYAFSGAAQEVDNALMQLVEAFHKSL